MITFTDFQPKIENRSLLSPLTEQIASAQFVVLSGPSGSGKSRFIETILDSHLPRAGEVVTDSPVVSVPQSLDLCRSSTAKDNVATARIDELSIWRANFRFNEEQQESALHWLQTLGFKAPEKQVFQLSGGEQQRVALARLLNSKRKIWLLDEPVSQLDDQAAYDCLAVVKSEAKKRNATVLCVLHQEKIAQALADRVFHWADEWRLS